VIFPFQGALFCNFLPGQLLFRIKKYAQKGDGSSRCFPGGERMVRATFRVKGKDLYIDGKMGVRYFMHVTYP
jgi:hypothetical protein